MVCGMNYKPVKIYLEYADNDMVLSKTLVILLIKELEYIMERCKYFKYDGFENLESATVVIPSDVLPTENMNKFINVAMKQNDIVVSHITMYGWGEISYD